MLSRSDVDTATRATISALKSLNLDCCLVGSVACSAYGMSRLPNDVDMVVFTSKYTQEELKNLLVAYDARFYLVRSKDPYATYRVLWFKLHTYESRLWDCKVDLLLPGVMNIPSIAPNQIRYRQQNGRGSSLSSTADYPLMPFLPLLLLKLQAWQDHGESAKAYMRTKQPTDVRDILELLQIAERRYPDPSTTSKLVGSETQVRHRSLLDKQIKHLPESFVRDARTRVQKFTMLHPTSAKQWKSIGFDVGTGSGTCTAVQRVTELERLMASMALNRY